MAANSVLLDFSIEPVRITDESSRKTIVKVIKENVEKYFGNLKIVYDMLLDDGYLCILSDNTGVVFTFRFFNEGLITINIEYFRKENEIAKISFEVRQKSFRNFIFHFIFQLIPSANQIRAYSRDYININFYDIKLHVAKLTITLFKSQLTLVVFSIRI